jgi:ribonuclease HI
MHFDGAFNTLGAGACAVLTSPTRDKLFYAVQLRFKPEYKVSNNIAGYEGLLTGLRATSAVGIKRIVVKGDSHLVINFSNKSYTPKEEHMVVYLEEHRKMAKRFLGMELKHGLRGENQEADGINRRASHRLPQCPGTFEERLLKPSATPPVESKEPLVEELPPSLTTGAPDCDSTSGDRTVLELTRQDEVD